MGVFLNKLRLIKLNLRCRLIAIGILHNQYKTNSSNLMENLLNLGLNLRLIILGDKTAKKVKERVVKGTLIITI